MASRAAKRQEALLISSLASSPRSIVSYCNSILVWAPGSARQIYSLNLIYGKTGRDVLFSNRLNRLFALEIHDRSPDALLHGDENAFMTEISRRNFLKLVGLASASTALGCSDPTRLRIPYINSPGSVIPGEASWFATTCRECPAGCGMLAKNRDTHVIKVEGNPEHPINQGKLCPRGQASLTRLYDPDRIKRPMRKMPNGEFAAVSWSEAEGILATEIEKTAGKSERLVFMTELVTGVLRGLSEHWAASLGGSHVLFEPFIYEPLKEANLHVFGRDRIPTYRIDEADFLISFNAGFLETWLSNVEYARRFLAFREPRRDGKSGNEFVFVGPRQSMTAVNADYRIRTAPGDEVLVAIGIFLALMDTGRPSGSQSLDKPGLRRLLGRHSLQDIALRTGVSEADLRAVARRFANSKKPLALAQGLTWFSPAGREEAMAANLLNTWSGGTEPLIDWEQDSAQQEVMDAAGLKNLFERMRSGGVDLFVFHNANPAFSLPLSWDVRGALKSVKTVISFSSYMDETTALADFILPAHTPLESWGEYSPKSGVTGILQPVMGNVFDTRPLGDILIRSGRKVGGEKTFPWKDFQALLLLSWNSQWKESGSAEPWEYFWAGILQKGGRFTEKAREKGSQSQEPSQTERASQEQTPPPAPAEERRQGERLAMVVYPTVQFYDGRMADSPWIQELPDPITQVTWGGWAEIHPDTAKRLQLEKGDLLEVRSDHGTIRVPALPMPSVNPGTVAVPLGQGHSEYGRFAKGLPGNPMALFPPEPDGGTPLQVSLRKTGERFAVANTDGSLYEHGRHIIETTTLEKFTKDLSSRRKPDITMPLPSGWDRKQDMYDAHVHNDYRWCMVVDLDRCTGCGACVVACYAENNVAFVGRERILQGREMSWIRVQRYFGKDDHHAHWLVMLCQHCDAAPCESVCPIYAPASQRGRIEQPDLQPLFRHALLLPERPLQGASLQLVHLDAAVAPGPSAEPGRDRTPEGGHGEMLLLHPADSACQDEGS